LNMPTYLTPGVYFESADEAGPSTASIRTDIAAFVGVAAQGPVHRATAVESWAQFQATFGAFLPNAYLAYAAKAFFENGGEKLYVVRVAAPQATTTTDSAVAQPADGSSSVVASAESFAMGAVVTAQQTLAAIAVGTQPVDRLSSLVDTVTGFVQGCLVQITQSAPSFQAWHRVQAVDASAKRLYWNSALETSFLLTAPLTFSCFQQADLLVSQVSGSTLTWVNGLGPSFNPAQKIQFETGIRASSGILNDGAGIATVMIAASSPGSWGDSIAVSVSLSSLAATATSSAVQPASGASSFVQSVVGFPRESWVRVFQMQGSLPVIDYRKVVATTPGTNLLQWNAPLVTKFNVTQPISFETVEFGLTVYVAGSAKESFSGLSLEPLHPRYIASVVNPQTSGSLQSTQVGMPSQYIYVRDLHSTTTSPGNLPDPSAPQLNHDVLALRGGRDGVAALQISDFIGDAGSEKKWGIRALEDVDEISIVAAPDILIQPSPVIAYTAPPLQTANPCLPCAPFSPQIPRPAVPPVEASPQFSLDDVNQVQQALIAHCEAMQFRFAILDPPDFGYPNLQVDLGEVQSWRHRFNSMYAALYYPWVLVLDPLQASKGVVRRIPPSGHVAGVYANSDLTTGVHKAPANTTMQWVQDLTCEVTSNMQAFLNPLSVNCIRSFSGQGIRVYGARTLSCDESWRFVNVRRLISMIEHSLQISMQWAVFEPNNVHLWNLVRASATSLLDSIWRKGALAGNTAADAYYVKCDLTTNPLAVTEVGQMVVEIGVAPARPAEFVVFRIGQVQDALEVTET
jgi:phage tail sheath protein FI